MKVADCMSRDVRIVSPDEPIRQAAQMMLEADTGALPVGSPEAVSGMITDRDIAVRAVALGRGPDTPVREAMSSDPIVCYEDQDLDDVGIMMSNHQVRRMPVLSREGRVVGAISLGDLVRSEDLATAESVLAGVTQPGGEHNQSSAL